MTVYVLFFIGLMSLNFFISNNLSKSIINGRSDDDSEVKVYEKD